MFAGGILEVVVNGRSLTLESGKHFWPSSGEKFEQCLKNER